MMRVEPNQTALYYSYRLKVYRNMKPMFLTGSPGAHSAYMSFVSMRVDTESNMLPAPAAVFHFD